MPNNVLLYWKGIVGVPGKGPNWMEPYDGTKTIGDLVNTLKQNRLDDGGKTIKIFKFSPGNLNRFDPNDLFWAESTRLSECVAAMGDYPDLFMVFVTI